MDLDVVVVNWNSGAFLARFLNSLAPLLPELHNAVVVDSASSDGSAEVAATIPALRFHRLQENLGFAAAANIGLARCTAPLVLLANPDIELDSDTVRCLHNRTENWPRCAITCPALVGEDLDRQEEFQIRDLPTAGSVLADVLFLDELTKALRLRKTTPRGVASHGAGESGILIEQPAAAFWMMRKSAWEEVGGFDESFAPAWFEDVDFCKRLKQTTWEIRYFPDLKIKHRGAHSLASLGYVQFLRIYNRNLLRYLLKHHRRAYPFLWLPVRIGGLVRRVLARS
jgi:GT2 family glycosyltransferase